MKKLLVIITAVFCAAILIAGNIHWNGKTNIGTNEAEAKKTTNEGTTKNIAEEQRYNTLLSFTANWPEEASAAFGEKMKKSDKYKILFVGSDALGEGENSWPELVKERMVRTYGDVFEFAVLSYTLTSSEFVEEGKEADLIQEKADLILFEPFTLKDNGRVVIEDSWDNTKQIMDAVKAAKEDTVFLLQPPHPIYNASWYLFQLENLERSAERAGIPYLNHWEKWPDTKDQTLNDYLAQDGNGPNEKGHQVWAEYLIDYFIAN